MRDTDVKVWICLFTVCSTRAVHLELVSGMTAELFLMCFKQFVGEMYLVSSFLITAQHLQLLVLPYPECLSIQMLKVISLDKELNGRSIWKRPLGGEDSLRGSLVL